MADLLQEYRYPVQLENEDVVHEVEYEFASAALTEDLLGLPAKVMERHLTEEEFIRFTSYQFGLAKYQFDVFKYLEANINLIKSSDDQREGSENF